MALIEIPATTGTGFTLRTGHRLRVVDLQGSQVCDLMAFRLGADHDPLSNGRTFDYGRKIHLSTGDTLWSSQSVPLLKIIADEVGRHDFLYAACSQEMYRIEYGITAPHPNCLDNLETALRSAGIAPRGTLPTPFNLFQNATVRADGTLHLEAPRSKAGQSVYFEALTDVVVALSACAASVCNGGRAKPVAYEILTGARSDG